MAISVVVAVADAADRLGGALVPRIGAIRVGSGMDPASQMGPLINNAHREKVTAYIESGAREGAKLVIDGRVHAAVANSPGYFLGPSLFDHVDPAMRIYREEIFGPVLCIVRVHTPDEALALVNAHEYGNGAAIFTRNGRAAREFVNNVKAGMVGVNVPIPVPMAFHSFGGWKRSMFGDSNMHGAEGVRFYTRTRTVTSRWPDDSDSTGAELDMPTAR
jgi:malonate-semialdehyde dehydrogenase (acetylating)/methylmalonate-semialdehyde dehydrogenase